jgi:hypothetical protein
MIRELCDMLRDLIEFKSLPFVDVVAGVARTIQYTHVDPNGSKHNYKIPVSWDTNITPCYAGQKPEKDLVPDSSKRGILYFEDNGATLERDTSYGNRYRATVNLICWYNKAKIVDNVYAHVQSTFIEMIKDALKIGRNPFNQAPFTGVIITITKIAPQDNTSFKKYTYNETTRQYLMPPFEFFNLTLDVRFTIAEDCIINNTQPADNDCWNWI